MAAYLLMEFKASRPTIITFRNIALSMSIFKNIFGSNGIFADA